MLGRSMLFVTRSFHTSTRIGNTTHSAPSGASQRLCGSRMFCRMGSGSPPGLTR